MQIGTMLCNKSEAEWQLAQQLPDDWERSKTSTVEDKDGQTYKYKESLDSAAFALKVPPKLASGALICDTSGI